jgi:hypothetical protein
MALGQTLGNYGVERMRDQCAGLANPKRRWETLIAVKERRRRVVKSEGIFASYKKP